MSSAASLNLEQFQNGVIGDGLSYETHHLGLYLPIVLKKVLYLNLTHLMVG